MAQLNSLLVTGPARLLNGHLQGTLSLTGGMTARNLAEVTTDFDTVADGIYHTYSNGNTENYITHAPVQKSQVLFSFTPYNSGTDKRTAQMSLTYEGTLYVRGFNGSTNSAAWRTVLTSSNYTSYAPVVHTGTAAPAASTGKNGDIYIVTS